MVELDTHVSTAQALCVGCQMCPGIQGIGYHWGESENHHLGENCFWYHQLGMP